jgi:hypothetical protein
MNIPMIVIYTVLTVLYLGTTLFTLWGLWLAYNFLFGDIIERNIQVAKVRQKWEEE